MKPYYTSDTYKKDLSKALNMSNQNWETTYKLSSTNLQELDWWKQSITKMNRLSIQKIVQRVPKVIIHIDASNTS